MKPSRWLVLAAAFAGCAGAYGIHVFGKHETAPPSAAAPAKSKTTASERTRSSFKPVSSSSAERRAHPDTHRATEPSAAVAAFQVRKVVGAPVFTAGKILSESQWRENATKVEMEANHELNRLTALLDLDSYQQEKIFSSLAQKSPYWLPGMQTGGGVRTGDSGTSGGNLATAGGAKQNRASGNRKPGTSAGAVAVVPAVQTGGGLNTSVGSSQPVSSDITVYLSPEQQNDIIQDAMDREEWWAEILPQLLPPPATKEFDGGEVLLEE